MYWNYLQCPSKQTVYINTEHAIVPNNIYQLQGITTVTRDRAWSDRQRARQSEWMNAFQFCWNRFQIVLNIICHAVLYNSMILGTTLN